MPPDRATPPPLTWTPGSLARALGVSPVTLRTWDRRYGLGPGVREPGRHRHYSEQDVFRLRRMVELTARGITAAVAAATALGEDLPDLASDVADPVPPDVAAVRGFLRAAERLDTPVLRRTAGRAVAERGVVSAWESLFLPVLVALGSHDGVDVEHVVSDGVQHALREVTIPVEAGRLPMLSACAPEELHHLPLDALAAALAEQGCPSRGLGARVPGSALVAAVDRLRPATVVVWAHDARRARSVPVDMVRRLDSTVIAAGPGWDTVDPGPCVVRVESLPDAVAAVLAGNSGLPPEVEVHGPGDDGPRTVG